MGSERKKAQRRPAYQPRAEVHWLEVLVTQVDAARIYTRDNIGRPLMTVFFPDDRALMLDGTEERSALTVFLEFIQRVYHPDWTEIPGEKAKGHPLYGVSGVLGILYLGAFVGLMGALLSAVPATIGALTGSVSVADALPATIAAALQLPFVYLTRRLDPRMPDIAIFCSWCAYPLAVIAAFATIGFWQGIGFVFGGIISIDFFALYLRRSRRVNVTFLKRIRVNEPDPNLDEGKATEDLQASRNA